MDVPVVTKNNPSNKPLKGLISASICVRKFVSARSAPARNAPSVSLKPNIWVSSEVPATVRRQSATKPSELRDSATTSKIRLRRNFPPKERRPSPPKAFKLSVSSIGQMLSSTMF
eukprot:TRINITY_DN3858_c0_g1_i4.p2 TRINITY_DN3858_c0_g1~~TRINITY_DN3858_c0_g1_i4.p2  ORF type:complete len:115 (+),score=24.61 TRINITY_DN3858_c0_g1_i4:867-1211(+)